MIVLLVRGNRQINVCCENATKPGRTLSYVATAAVVVVRAIEAVTIEEAYFWSTTHAETDPVVDSGGEGERQRERERSRQTER